MKPVPFANVPAALWNQSCDQSGDAWLFHRSQWIDMESHHFGQRNLSFALLQDGSSAAVVPLYFVNSGTFGNEALLHTGMHRHAGPAFADRLSERERRKAEGAAMAWILAQAETLDADRIQLNLCNLAPARFDANRGDVPFWVERYGFSLGIGFGPLGLAPIPGFATCNADQIVDLSYDEERLFAALDDRASVRKARANGIEFSVGSEASSVDRFYAIAQKSATRTGEELLPVDYYRDLWRHFAGESQSAILFARHSQQDVAAIILLVYKHGASYLAGVSDPEYLPMRVNDFLHWSAMLWAKQSGITRYRFGPWFPEVPAFWPISRVSKFKTKFGSRPYSVIQGSWFRRPEKYLAAGTKLLEALCGPRDG